LGVLNDLPLHLKKLEDTKGVIRSCKSTKDKQYNGQKKKDERTNNKMAKTKRMKGQTIQWPKQNG